MPKKKHKKEARHFAKKEQAALEYLVTYGWAILVVLVAIAGLAYFGVFSSDKFVPSKCLLPPGIACLDFKVENDAATGNGRITLRVQNSLGEDISINNIAAADCGTLTTLTPLLNGEAKTLYVDCTAPISTSKYNEQINITYASTLSGITHTLKGDITSPVSGEVQQITPPPDTLPPTVSITAPTPNQVFASGTMSATLAVTTDEAATCRWDATDQAYSSMPSANTMSGSGTTSHTATISGLTDGNSYTRYVRCQDTAGNPTTTSQSVTFSVASAPSLPQPADIYEFGFEDGTSGQFNGNGNQGPMFTEAGTTWVLDTTMAVRGTNSASQLYPNSRYTIQQITAGNPTLIRADGSMASVSGTTNVNIRGVTGNTPSINNNYAATKVDADQFTIPVDTTVAGSGGTVGAPNTGNVGKAFIYNLPSSRQSVYVRFAYKQSNPFNNNGVDNNADNTKLLRFIKSGNGFAGSLFITRSGTSDGKLLVSFENLDPVLGQLYNSNVGDPNQANFNLQIGQWVWVEAYLNISSNPLIWNVWVNDVLTHNYTLPVSTSDQILDLVFDGIINSMNGSSTAWFDHVGISTQRMGIPP